MKELLAFILPPATALAGMRISALILGAKFSSRFGFGFRFTYGLAVGMLVFTQAILFSALVGINAAFFLAWFALLWGGVEAVLLALKLPAACKTIKFQPGHLWLLLLLPLGYFFWVFGRLSTLEGTLEFDANAFWVFKAKILFLEQGQNLISYLHEPNLAYAHMDYPMLVPCLYTLDYGAVGMVDEFVNKVWPFWMVFALCLGILSLGNVWKCPSPLPVIVVLLMTFLPATLQYIRNEGGTIPMCFFTSLASLLIVSVIRDQDVCTPAALVLLFAGCFSTKLEGAVFSAFCCVALLPICLKQNWLKNKVFIRSAAVAIICLLPYVFFRFIHPIAHPESAWLHQGLDEPKATFCRFPQMWFLGIVGCFFSQKYFHWDADGSHLIMTGQWNGWSSFIHEQLSILPWLLIFLLCFSIIYNVRGRVALIVLSGVILLLFTFLSVTTACLAEMHDSLSHAIGFASGTVDRLLYPFFIAWFLGVVSVWFSDEGESTKKLMTEKPTA